MKVDNTILQIPLIQRWWEFFPLGLRKGSPKCTIKQLFQIIYMFWCTRRPWNRNMIWQVGINLTFIIFPNHWKLLSQFDEKVHWMRRQFIVQRPQKRHWAPIFDEFINTDQHILSIFDTNSSFFEEEHPIETWDSCIGSYSPRMDSVNKQNLPMIDFSHVNINAMISV